MFRYFAHGDLYLLIHGTESPDDATWDRYVDALGRADRPKGFLKILVLTEGGGPTGPQRARLEAVTVRGDRPAGVSSAAIPRFAVSVIALMNRSIRSFAPGDFDRAVEFLGLSADERRAALQQIESLKREGSLGALRVLDETLASALV